MHGYTSLLLLLLNIYHHVQCHKNNLSRTKSVTPRPHAALGIVNGTATALYKGQDDFVFCFADVSDVASKMGAFSVSWFDPKGRPVASDNHVAPQSVYTTQDASQSLPHSYLVLRDFQTRRAGLYTCAMAYRNRILAVKTIQLRMFHPTFQLKPLPVCMELKEGKTAVLPPPVVGKPSGSVRWTRRAANGCRGAQSDDWDAMEGTRVVKGRLPIEEVTGSTADEYTATVELGGGLTYRQSVQVSVRLRKGGLALPVHSSTLCSRKWQYSSARVRQANFFNRDVATSELQDYRSLLSATRDKNRCGK